MAYWPGKPACSAPFEPAEVSAQCSREEDGVRIGGEFDPRDSVTVGNLADVSTRRWSERRKRTGSSSAFIASNGMRTAQTESQDEASR